MISITKEFKWSMGHMLEKHCGLCKNVHGHNYKLLLTVKREYENELKDVELLEHNTSGKGMVVDFKELKFLANKHIVEPLDHAFMFNQTDELNCLIVDDLIKKMPQKVYPVSFRTTAENISKWIFEKMNEVFIEENNGLKCIRVVLYETDSSYAEYEVNENENK